MLRPIRIRRLLRSQQRRASDRKAQPALERLEDRHMPAVSLSGGLIKAPPTAAEVSILFPVFRIAPKSEASLAWVRSSEFRPAEYTNPCFIQADRLMPTAVG